MSDWSFIESFASKNAITPEALRKWRVRGVPAQYRLAIVDAAKLAGFSFDRAVFDNPPGPITKVNGHAETV